MKNKYLWFIFGVVAAVHFAFLLWAWMPSQTTSKPLIARKQVVVKTVALQPAPPKNIEIASPVIAEIVTPEPPAPPPPKPAPEPKPVPAPAPKPKPTAAPPPKPIKPPEPKAVIPKKPTPPPPPPAPAPETPKPKQPSAAQQALLAKAKASLSQVAKPTTVANPTTTTAVTIPSLQIEGVPSKIEKGSPSYQSLVAGHLQGALVLPERGKANVSLTIDRSGKVIHYEIINSGSAKNRTYLQENLSNLSFPPFGLLLDKDKETFELTLTSSY